MSCICSPRMEKKSLRLKRVKDPLILISRKNKVVRLKKLNERLDFNVTRDDLTRFMVFHEWRNSCKYRKIDRVGC